MGGERKVISLEGRREYIVLTIRALHAKACSMFPFLAPIHASTMPLQPNPFISSPSTNLLLLALLLSLELSCRHGNYSSCLAYRLNSCICVYVCSKPYKRTNTLTIYDMCMYVCSACTLFYFRHGMSHSFNCTQLCS